MPKKTRKEKARIELRKNETVPTSPRSSALSPEQHSSSRFFIRDFTKTIVLTIIIIGIEIGLLTARSMGYLRMIIP